MASEHTATARLTLALAASVVFHGALLAPLASSRLRSGSQQPTAAFDVILTSPSAEREVPVASTRKVALEALAASVMTPAKPILPTKAQPGEGGLDSPPQPLVDIAPDYPEGAFALGLSGKVEVEVWVDEKGRVENARVVETTMADAFNSSALKAVHDMRFTPGMSGGLPVKSSIRAVIVYDLR